MQLSLVIFVLATFASLLVHNGEAKPTHQDLELELLHDFITLLSKRETGLPGSGPDSNPLRPSVGGTSNENTGGPSENTDGPSENTGGPGTEGETKAETENESQEKETDQKETLEDLQNKVQGLLERMTEALADALRDRDINRVEELIEELKTYLDKSKTGDQLLESTVDVAFTALNAADGNLESAADIISPDIGDGLVDEAESKNEEDEEPEEGQNGNQDKSGDQSQAGKSGEGQGEQGNKGPGGDQGSKGPGGDEGNKGPEGDEGNKGPEGDQGGNRRRKLQNKLDLLKLLHQLKYD